MYNNRQLCCKYQNSSLSHRNNPKLGSRVIAGVLSTTLLLAPLGNAFAQRKNIPSTNNQATTAMPEPVVDNSHRFVDARHPQAMDLIKLFQEAAQYDPTYLSAKNNYIAGK